MRLRHPHWFVHYVPQGSVFTACGRRCIEVTHSSQFLAEVDCRWCVQTDVYLADSMESSLSKGLEPNELQPEVFGAYKVPTTRFTIK